MKVQVCVRIVADVNEETHVYFIFKEKFENHKAKENIHSANGANAKITF